MDAKHTLNDVYGLDSIKAWLRQDVALWRKNDLAALPKGYLLCGPAGTGKTYLVECLAGEAAVPVVKMKNFRDKWVGSSEGNLGMKLTRLWAGVILPAEIPASVAVSIPCWPRRWAAVPIAAASSGFWPPAAPTLSRSVSNVLDA